MSANASASGWNAARAAYKGTTVTRLFKTLRDMNDGMTIAFDDLQYVRSLGGVYLSMIVFVRFPGQPSKFAHPCSRCVCMIEFFW